MTHKQHSICKLINDLLDPILKAWREKKQDKEDDAYDELRV